ncbi:3'-5' exonuclease [Prevotella lascolaii]|jgi:ribonuclease D|uniref:3'-5' exonuclease n=2 Tax=Leyella lascolaii TaxID=1776379 RepID=A0AAW7JKM0_9BACT|nr:3'-5' exonuclease [Leyella lascolaii]MDN0022571.1 3'-5' exonuclease [Leyella lascolaii]MDN0025432.1 3'-5' exonuclease [Leyella lascolaii]
MQTMKTIYNRLDKEYIKDLPLVSFPGKIITVNSEREADKAVPFLLSKDILGVDTETRPSFKKGQQHKVSLLQVATEDICFLFRLNYIGMVTPVISLLSNTDVPMVGLSWHDDLAALQKRMEFKPGLFIDIQDIIGDIGIEDKSLQKLYANIFKQKISKRQRLTNWDADVLSDKQMSYAATDAWACVRLYKEILKLKETGDYSLIIKDDINNSIANV